LATTFLDTLTLKDEVQKKFVATFYYAEDMAEPMTTQLISVLMYNLDL
jgi:hypothetical protein